MQKGLITGVILGVLMVILAFQNAVKVPVKLFFWEYDAVFLYLIIGFSFLSGVLLNGMFSVMVKYRLKRMNKKLQNRINDLEEKLVEFRSKEAEDLISEDGLNIEGDPGFKYFDDSPM